MHGSREWSGKVAIGWQLYMSGKLHRAVRLMNTFILSPGSLELYGSSA